MWTSKYSKTTNKQYVKIKGTIGETEEKWCDANFDVIDRDVSCVFVSDVNIGGYRCISLRTGGNDGIDFTKVIDT